MSFKFEHELNHPYAGAVFGVNHKYSDTIVSEIVLIRTIEQNKEAIAKDPQFLLPFANFYGTEKEDSDSNTMKYLYKNYCSTTLNNLDKVVNSYIRDAINLAFLHS